MLITNSTTYAPTKSIYSISQPLNSAPLIPSPTIPQQTLSFPYAAGEWSCTSIPLHGVATHLVTDVVACVVSFFTGWQLEASAYHSNYNKEWLVVHPLSS